jgi:hypothetical protein
MNNSPKKMSPHQKKSKSKMILKIRISYLIMRDMKTRKRKGRTLFNRKVQSNLKEVKGIMENIAG